MYAKDGYDITEKITKELNDKFKGGSDKATEAVKEEPAKEEKK